MFGAAPAAAGSAYVTVQFAVVPSLLKMPVPAA
jgi:hypothetical protein